MTNMQHFKNYIPMYVLMIFIIIFYTFWLQYSGRKDGLRILAFPCNQFAEEEPGTDAEIKAFADGKGFQGDLFQKTEVNGKGQHPLWAWLKSTKVS